MFRYLINSFDLKSSFTMSLGLFMKGFVGSGKLEEPTESRRGQFWVQLVVFGEEKGDLSFCVHEVVQF